MSSGIELTKKDKTYVDLSLAFKPSPLTNDITTLKNERSINNAIKNIVMFLPLEVPFNRDIGSNATRYLFELVDEATAALLSQEIERAILFCEPRVTFSNPSQAELTVSEYQKAEFNQSGELFMQDDLGVTVNSDVDSNTYEVTVKYRIVGSVKRIVVQQILTPTR
jgi:phage baseplate assembly protein W